MGYTSIDYNELHLPVEEIYEAMGYSGDSVPEDVIADAVQDVLRIAAVKVNPSCFFTIQGADILGESIVSGNTEFDTGKIIAKLLRGSDQVALFVATAGMGFERWTHELKEEGDYLNMFIADSIGTCIVEKAGDYVERMLEREITGLKHTNRFSPGYCGWPVAEQRKLFAHLPEGVCGIELKESCLMVPIKSISGIIGIGADVRAKVYSCHVCDMDSCFRRRNNRIAV